MGVSGFRGLGFSAHVLVLGSLYEHWKRVHLISSNI